MNLFYFFTQPDKNNRSINFFLFLIENFFTFEKSYFFHKKDIIFIQIELK